MGWIQSFPHLSGEPYQNFSTAWKSGGALGSNSYWIFIAGQKKVCILPDSQAARQQCILESNGKHQQSIVKVFWNVTRQPAVHMGKYLKHWKVFTDIHQCISEQKGARERCRIPTLAIDCLTKSESLKLCKSMILRDLVPQPTCCCGGDPV